MGLLAGFVAAATIYSAWKSYKSTGKQGEAAAAEARRVAAANKKISDHDAAVMKELAIEGHYSDSMNLLLLHEQQLNIMKTITTSYGKSGVVSSTGSALDVSAESAKDAAYNIEMVKYNREKAYQHRMNLAKRYKMLGAAGLRDAAAYAANILETSKDEARAKLITAIPTIYKAGEVAGWWE